MKPIEPLKSISLMTKRPEPKADYSPPPSSEFKNDWIYTAIGNSPQDSEQYGKLMN